MLFSGIVYKRKVDLLIGVVGVSAVVSTLHRGTLISGFLVLMLTLTFIRGRFPWRYPLYAGILALAYFGSQLVYLNAVGEGLVSAAGETAVLSSLPEIRDLGWTISQAGEQRFYGATFLVPMIPGPGILTDFKEKYGLGYLTARLCETQEGLRITLPGEGYLNFGVFGFLIIGVPLGMFFTSLSNLAKRLLTARDLPSSFLLAVILSWIYFWFYLGGTANAVTNLYEIMFIFAMFWMARPRRLTVGRSVIPTAF
jgi:hypothetical protein